MNDKNNNLTDTVNVTIHTRTLADKTCSYAKVKRNTAYVGNLVTKILEQNKVFDRETLLYTAGLFRNAILSLLESGKAVELFEMGTLYIKPRNGVKSANPDLNDISDMVLAFTPSELALSSVKNVTAGADVTASNNPEICELYDMHTETKGTVLSAGYTARITGRRLKVAGNEDETGIFFVPCDEEGKYDESSARIQVKPNKLIDNTMGQIVMNVPQSLQSGTYRLIVQTAYGSGARINKTVRKGVFEEIVTVA